jgi:hypothetical protein
MGSVEAGTEVSVTLTWSLCTDPWQGLRLELEREAEAVLASSGEVVIVAPDRDSGSVIRLVFRTRSLKLTFYPDRNAVRWDTPDEYSFERIPEDPTSLARSLMQRLRR